MNTFRLFIIATLVCLASACAREAPPVLSVGELLDSPLLLEAAMLRCSHERSKTKYDAECVNARDASNRLAAIEREARRMELEAQSVRKRQALRRTQQAAAEARRRAAEAQRLREQEEYLGIYEIGLDDGAGLIESSPGIAAIPPAENQDTLQRNQPDVSIPLPHPQGEEELEAELPADSTDINSIREELKRRQDAPG